MLPAPWEGGAELTLHKEQLQMLRQQAAGQTRPDTDRKCHSENDILFMCGTQVLSLRMK